MSETLHANIFFFITSVAVVAVTMMSVVVLWYVVAILREVRKIAMKVSRASEGLESDFAYIREEIRQGSTTILSFLHAASGFFLGGLPAHKKRASSKKKVPTETESAESV